MLIKKATRRPEPVEYFVWDGSVSSVEDACKRWGMYPPRKAKGTEKIHGCQLVLVQYKGSAGKFFLRVGPQENMKFIDLGSVITKEDEEYFLYTPAEFEAKFLPTI